MKCPSCGNENENGIKFCSLCGAKMPIEEAQAQQDQPQIMQQEQKVSNEPVYKKTWFVIVMLIFFFPVGVVLMWLYKKNWKLPIKIIISVLFLFWILGLFAGNSDDGSKSETLEGTEVVQTTEVSETTTATTLQTTTTEKTTELTTTEQQQNLTGNILLDTEFYEKNVYSGDGKNKIGKYGLINVKKEDLKNVTNDQYDEFCKNVVDDSGYNWVIIICDDGTGICFPGSISYVADYGILNKEKDGIDQKIGTVVSNFDGTYSYTESTPEEVSDGNSSSNVSTGMKNALDAAINYLNFMPFSYDGLINQLEYDQYTHEEAVYGADNCGADWNEQAAKSAQNYIDFMSFSRQELIDQLIYDGYTQEQAEYGVQSVGY